MGRVSRIMKAVSGPAVDPSGLSCGQELARSDDELRVMACWKQMPEHFKRTVMTLVEIVESRRAETPRKASS